MKRKRLQEYPAYHWPLLVDVVLFVVECFESFVSMGTRRSEPYHLKTETDKIVSETSYLNQ